jgi:PAS domain S-box-containing protein
MLASAGWTVVVAFNVWPGGFLPAHVSMTFRNGLILAMLLGWLLLVLEYTRRERVSVTPLPAALVLAVPVLTVVLTATNPLHHLELEPGTPTTVGGGPGIVWGPWHLVFMGYAFVMSFVPAGLLVRDLRSSSGVHRKQLVFLLVGFGIGFLGLNDYLVTGAIGGVPSYVRTSPFVLVLATGFWVVAVFQHRLFGMVPVSRRTAVETIPDPVVVADRNETIVDANSAAKRLFGLPDTAAGTDLNEFSSEYLDVEDGVPEAARNVDIDIADDGIVRHYSLTRNTVRDEHTGTVLVLRDVTELKEYEQRLEEQRDGLELLNQVVRHDIRNDLQVVMANAETLEAALDDDTEADERLQALLDAVDHAVDLTETAREMAAVTLSAPDDAGSVDLRTVLHEQIAEVRSTYPAAEIGIVGSIPAVSVRTGEMIDAVFRNVLKNGVQHNDKAVPEIEVSATERGESVTIRIADNGPGIPEDVREAVFDQGETGLDSSGTGIGLYLVRTLVDRYDGDVWIEDNEPEGTVFVVELLVS